MYSIKKLITTDSELTRRLRTYTFDLLGCCQQVHRELGPFLNEYMYQDALEILLLEKGISHIREYGFSVEFHNQKIPHKHIVDFFCKEKVFIECKAIEHNGPAQRQQLWNYMRLTNTPIGILYNFAPIIDEGERYYLDAKTKTMYAF